MQSLRNKYRKPISVMKAICLRCPQCLHDGRAGTRATETRSITPPSAKELDAVIKRVTGRWKADVTVGLVDGFADLPPNIQQAARDQGSDGSDIRGVFHQGTIYVVRDNIGIRTSGLLPSYLPVRNQLLPALINQSMMISGRWGGPS